MGIPQSPKLNLSSQFNKSGQIQKYDEIMPYLSSSRRKKNKKINKKPEYYHRDNGNSKSLTFLIGIYSHNKSPPNRFGLKIIVILFFIIIIIISLSDRGHTDLDDGHRERMCSESASGIVNQRDTSAKAHTQKGRFGPGENN